MAVGAFAPRPCVLARFLRDPEVPEMVRFLANPLFWLLTLMLTWLTTVTLLIASHA